MNSSLASNRIDVPVFAYAEFGDNGTQVWHPTRNELKVLDRDCVNFKDFTEGLDQGIKHGPIQKLFISFWDKVSHSFTKMSHDTLFLTAIDLYWDERTKGGCLFWFLLYVICICGICYSLCSKLIDSALSRYACIYTLKHV
jgi:hypothetical protein